MLPYLSKRLVAIFPVLLMISIAVFALMRLIPGDTALLMVAGGQGGNVDPQVMETLRHQLGLDQPYLVQYGNWMWKMLRYGDMGKSFWTGQPVLVEIVRRLPVTFELAVWTLIIAQLFAIPAGVLSAIRQGSTVDYAARLTGIAGLALPGFWIGTLFIIFPAIWFGYVPPPGYVPFWSDPWVNFQQFILPSVAMGLNDAARSMRMTRSQMLEVVRQEYVLTAWSKGLREAIVVSRHALRNAMIPVVTVVGMDFGYLLGRTVVLETVFSLPGLGSLTLSAILHRDYAQIQGNVLFIAAMFVAVNLVVDVLYAWLDPRIRYA